MIAVIFPHRNDLTVATLFEGAINGSPNSVRLIRCILNAARFALAEI
jgi:hypothetical protein